MNRIRLRSIQFIITISFMVITILVVLIVSLMLYNKFSKTAEENAYLNIQQIIEQVNSNLENYVNGMIDIYEVVEDQIDKSPTISSPILAEQLRAILKSREDLKSIALYTRKGDLVLNIPSLMMRKNTRLEQQSWFEAAIQRPKELTFSSPHIENLFKGQYSWVVSQSRQIKYADKSGRKQDGVLLVDVNFKTIDEISKKVSLGKKGYIYIIDSLGNIVYHPQQQLIYAGLKYENLEQVLSYSYGSYVDHSTGESRLITIKTVEPIGWKVVGVAYTDEILTTKQDLNQFIFWVLVVVILLVLLISIYMSAKISRPIKMLEKSVKKVEQGDFNTRINVKGAYEVEQLSHQFNLMIGRIGQLMDQIIYEQEAKRKSELDVLQSQINPHFLYNTLNSVIRFAQREKKEEVITMINSLSKFFRISLSKGKNIITVQDELEHVRNYLVIQNMRYKNKFQYKIEAEEKALSCLTLKLILQPIVENAIVHGIEMMADEGFIHISVNIVGDKLLFQVTDNGLGMSEETMQQLLTGHLKSEHGSSVGVKNVHERIRLYYGDEYGLQFESELEEGTTVCIWIPAVYEDEGGGVT
ncbi:sensor histidine kinase [Paenibacillus sediminis]|nr:histidine kinase [Paenibacillus sediminis]